MQQFPKIVGPCPLQRPYAEIVIGSHCAVCNRTVHDLDTMDEAAREALLRGRGDSICVKYTLQSSQADMGPERTLNAAGSGAPEESSCEIEGACEPLTDVSEAGPDRPSSVVEQAPDRLERRDIEVRGLIETFTICPETPGLRRQLDQLDELRKQRESHLSRLRLEAQDRPTGEEPERTPECPRCAHGPRAGARYCTNCGIRLVP
jgi:hypothetical protein